MHGCLLHPVKNLSSAAEHSCGELKGLIWYLCLLAVGQSVSALSLAVTVLFLAVICCQDRYFLGAIAMEME